MTKSGIEHVQHMSDAEAPGLSACVRIDDFDIAAYRRSLGMSQPEFAKFHGISVGTLRQWEQQRAEPLLNRSVKNIFMGWVRQQLSKSGVHVAVS